MPALSPQEKKDLQARFKKEMKKEVHITLYTVRSAGLLILPGRECQTCPQVQELLSELVSLSPKLKLAQVDFYTESARAQEENIQRIPCITLSHPGATTSNIRFFGIPAGYGFSAFIETIITLSKEVSPLQLPTRKALRKLDAPFSLRVFVAPGCTYSPGIARLAHAMALENPKILAEVIEVQEFPQLAQQYGVRSVPKTIINDMTEVQGAVPEFTFLDRILTGVGRNDVWEQTGLKKAPGIPSGPTTPIR